MARSDAVLWFDPHAVRYFVRVDLACGRSTWPLLLENGVIAWDYPGAGPKFLMPKVRRLLLEARSANVAIRRLGASRWPFYGDT